MPYARLLVEDWARLAKERGTLEHSVPGTSMRHSMSGKCARAIHYYLTGAEVTNPFDLPSYWSTGLGTSVHEWWQDVLARVFPDAVLEAKVHIPEADSSGHVDAWLPEVKTAIELKSINGYGYKMIVEKGEGPRQGDVVQLAVNAHALGAETAVLVYLSLEAISKPRAKNLGLSEINRIATEFEFTREFFEPIALKEIRRWAKIRELGKETPRQIPDPEFQPGARVVDPLTGRMEKDGSPCGKAWQCNYCSYQTLCAEDLNGLL